MVNMKIVISTSSRLLPHLSSKLHYCHEFLWIHQPPLSLKFLLFQCNYLDNSDNLQNLYTSLLLKVYPISWQSAVRMSKVKTSLGSAKELTEST